MELSRLQQLAGITAIPQTTTLVESIESVELLFERELSAQEIRTLFHDTEAFIKGISKLTQKATADKFDSFFVKLQKIKTTTFKNKEKISNEIDSAIDQINVESINGSTQKFLENELKPTLKDVAIHSPQLQQQIIALIQQLIEFSNSKAKSKNLAISELSKIYLEKIDNEDYLKASLQNLLKSDNSVLDYLQYMETTFENNTLKSFTDDVGLTACLVFVGMNAKHLIELVNNSSVFSNENPCILTIFSHKSFFREFVKKVDDVLKKSPFFAFKYHKCLLPAGDINGWNNPQNTFSMGSSNYTLAQLKGMFSKVDNIGDLLDQNKSLDKANLMPALKEHMDLPIQLLMLAYCEEEILVESFKDYWERVRNVFKNIGTNISNWWDNISNTPNEVVKYANFKKIEQEWIKAGKPRDDKEVKAFIKAYLIKAYKNKHALEIEEFTDELFKYEEEHDFKTAAKPENSEPETTKTTAKETAPKEEPASTKEPSGEETPKKAKGENLTSGDKAALSVLYNLIKNPDSPQFKEQIVKNGNGKTQILAVLKKLANAYQITLFNETDLEEQLSKLVLEDYRKKAGLPLTEASSLLKAIEIELKHF